MPDDAPVLPPPSAPSGRAPIGVAAGAMRVFDLSLGQMLWSRRTLFMALVVGLPIVIALALRMLVEFGAPIMRARGTTLSGGVVFGLMMWGFYLRFAAPVLAVFYGTALIADEVEDKTLTYLFTRPVSRSAVLLGKYLAYLVCTAGVVLPSVMIVWLLLGSLNDSLANTFLSLAKDLAILALALTAYGALFACVGAAVRRPLLAGLVFVFGWESLALALPGFLKYLTVAYYIQGLVPHAMPSESPLAVLEALFQQSAGLTASLGGLAAITIGALWVAARAVTRREYVLEQ